MSVLIPGERALADALDFGFTDTAIQLGGEPVSGNVSNSVAGTDVKAPGSGDGIFDFFGDAARTVGELFDPVIGLYRDFVQTELQFEFLQNLREQPQ